MTIYLARQPILDRSRKRRGYELLYRSGEQDMAFFADPDDATRTVVERSLLEWGLTMLVGDGTAFVNVTAEFLASGMYTVLPANRVVLELLETIRLDESTITAVRDAIGQGYRFALDDVVTTNVHGFEHIAPMVEIVKVEVIDLDPDTIHSLLVDLRALSPRVTLLAEKVETVESFELCKELGFDLFQGYFFAKPEVMSRRKRPISHHAALLVVIALQDPAISIDRLADLANSDPTLAYRLLRLVNASATGLTDPVESVRHAIVLLGIDHVRQLATLLAMTANAVDNQELITLALTRAHMARQLLGGQAEATNAFTAGLLSVIDVLFDTPMADLMAELPVAPCVHQALISGTGPIGDVLNLIYTFEQNRALSPDAFAAVGIQKLAGAFGAAAAATAAIERELNDLGIDRPHRRAGVAPYRSSMSRLPLQPSVALSSSAS